MVKVKGNVKGIARDIKKGTVKDKSEIKGFSLIELMVTVAVIGIIAAIALPSYRDSVLRSGRADGKSMLLRVASMQEQFYSVNNSYTTYAVPLAAPAQATAYTSSGNYEVNVSACGGGIASCFIATAVPQDSQAEDTCGNLTLTNTGVRAASGGTQDQCWAR